MLNLFRGKLRKIMLAVAIIVLCLHALQWKYIYCGIVIFNQNSTEGYTYIVRAMPIFPPGYIFLSAISLKYYPKMLACRYQCEIWRNNTMLTSHSYYWDSMYSPAITLTSKSISKDSLEIQYSFYNIVAAKCTISGNNRNTVTWTEINLDKN